MKTGILLSARLGSTRLKQKHLIPVNHIPIMGYLIERIRTEFSPEITRGELEVIICSADEENNKPFLHYFQNVLVFFGSVSNIPKRQLQAARHHSLDQIVAVDGDDILCSTKGMRAVLEALNKGEQYAATSGLPFGMNCMGYKTAYLEQCLIKSGDKEVLETGWGRIFDPTVKKEIVFTDPAAEEILRFTLDYQADFDFFHTIISQMGNELYQAADSHIVQLVKEKELYRINGDLAQEYWANFYKQVKKEGN